MTASSSTAPSSCSSCCSTLRRGRDDHGKGEEPVTGRSSRTRKPLRRAARPRPGRRRTRLRKKRPERCVMSVAILHYIMLLPLFLLLRIGARRVWQVAIAPVSRRVAMVVQQLPGHAMSLVQLLSRLAAGARNCGRRGGNEDGDPRRARTIPMQSSCAGPGPPPAINLFPSANCRRTMGLVRRETAIDKRLPPRNKPSRGAACALEKRFACYPRPASTASTASGFRFPMIVFLELFFLFTATSFLPVDLTVRAAYFPLSLPKGTVQPPATMANNYITTEYTVADLWVRPLMLPWEPLRGTKDSILVTWTTGWHPYCSVLRSVLQRRYPLSIGSMNLDLRNRNQEAVTWYNSTANTVGFSPWQTVYEGPGKAFENTGLLPGHPYEFRVKTIGKNILQGGYGPGGYGGGAVADGVGGTTGVVPSAGNGLPDATLADHESASDWSVPQMVHTNYDPMRERFPIRLQGMSAHNPDYAIIEIDGVALYRRRDEKGLVLAVFSRWNMQLIWLKTYNTFNHPGDSNGMARDLRKLDQSHFVAVVSTDAWEWNVTPSLIKAMEFCGAYHFATWSRAFGGSHIKMPTQTGFDVDQTSSQIQFGNPYALWGIPGIGSGMGFESVAWPSSQYLFQKLAPNAIVRLILYMDYVVRHYFVSLPSVDMVAVDFLKKAVPPPYESLHNPYSYAQRAAECEPPNCRIFSGTTKSFIQEDFPYKVYHGELRVHMDRLIESNRTLDPHYYHFFLFTNSSVYKMDPRPASKRVTELERVWGGPSERYHFNVSAQQFQRTFAGIPYGQRFCRDLFHELRFEINPITCKNTTVPGSGMTTCCDYLDYKIPFATPEDDYYLGLRCGVGVVSTLCNETIKNVWETVAPITEQRAIVNYNQAQHGIDLPTFLPNVAHAPPFNHTYATQGPHIAVFSKLPPTQPLMAAMLGLQI